MRSVTLQNRQILIDGVPVQIRSGAMHYFRLLPSLWASRIEALRSCGLNTLETYMAWNLHEKQEDQFDFSGYLDIAEYLRMAQKAGLYVILRPGPYICSELDLGGLPAWLLPKKCHLRSSDPGYYRYAVRYLSRVFEQIRPLLYTNGGPIIAVQVENEYGGDSLDHDYLQNLCNFFKEEGIDVPLFCSDGNGVRDLTIGSVDGAATGVNGRNHPAAMCKTLAKVRPDDPPFVMELWNGAGQHWNEDFIEHRAADVAADIREAMEQKINFNLYMFHGGTSWGLMSGSDGGYCEMPFRPLLTSYDVDGTLPEGGIPGEKFYAVRNEILRALPDLKLPDPPLPERKGYGAIELTQVAPLLPQLAALSKPCASLRPLRFEELGCYYGFVLYRFRAPYGGVLPLSVDDLRDRAQLFVDGVYCGTFDRNTPGAMLYAKADAGSTLDLLVENTGRLRNNTFHLSKEHKGLNALCIGIGHEILNCECFPLPLEDLSALKFQSAENFTTDEPAFWRGTFEVEETADTYLRIPAGTHGILWLNGFNLGRYRNAGPQYTLYAPACLLKRETNELILFELEHLGLPLAWSQEKPDLGRKRPLPL